MFISLLAYSENEEEQILQLIEIEKAASEINT